MGLGSNSLTYQTGGVGAGRGVRSMKFRRGERAFGGGRVWRMEKRQRRNWRKISDWKYKVLTN